MLHRRLDERLRRDAAVLLEDLLVEGTGVNADANRDAGLFGGLDDGPDLLLAADVARVEAQGVDALVDGLERELVVKVDVGDERHGDLAQYIAEVLGGLHVGHGEPHDIAACGLQGADLGDSRLGIRRLRIRHRLHGDRRTAADRDLADVDLARRTALL